MDRKTEFAMTMSQLGNYFGLKITPEITKSYYNQLYYIPQPSFNDICQKIISERKPFKTQFPTISQFGPLYESHKPHTDHVSDEFTPESCDECGGEGLIYYKLWNFKLGTAYVSHVACSECRNWKRFYSILESYAVYTGDGKFLFRHPGIEETTKDQLKLKRGVIEVPENGVFIMTKDEISNRVLMFYGKTH